MTDETIIRTLRHAQSTYGPQQRYAGSVDVPLSEKGEGDCREAAKALAGLDVDVVVTSNLKRAIDTARLVGYEPSRCVRSDLCNERRYGVLEGRTWQEVQAFDTRWTAQTRSFALTPQKPWREDRLGGPIGGPPADLHVGRASDGSLSDAGLRSPLVGSVS